MLSIQLCKKLLKNDIYTNQQIKEIHDNLYQLAELLISKYILNKNNKLLPTKKVKKMKDMKTKERFLELRAQGFSYYKIAKDLKVSKQTLINWSNELGIELDNLKAIELDKLQREYYIASTERIKLFGEKLKALIKEIDNRDLKDLSTDKLLDYLLKFLNILKNEEVQPIFRKKFIRDLRGKLPDHLIETYEDWLA